MYWQFWKHTLLIMILQLPRHVFVFTGAWTDEISRWVLISARNNLLIQQLSLITSSQASNQMTVPHSWVYAPLFNMLSKASNLHWISWAWFLHSFAVVSSYEICPDCIGKGQVHKLTSSSQNLHIPKSLNSNIGLASLCITLWLGINLVHLWLYNILTLSVANYKHLTQAHKCNPNLESAICKPTLKQFWSFPALFNVHVVIDHLYWTCHKWLIQYIMIDNNITSAW